MEGLLEVRLGVSPVGLQPRAYTAAVNELTLSLEELERVAEPNPRERVSWYISDTSWRSFGPVVQLRPSLEPTSQRSTAALLRPGRALVAGVLALSSAATIPADFTERIVNRISAVGALTHRETTGVQSVEVVAVDAPDLPAGIDSVVDANARLAVAPVSLAYGSVTGRLDVISARKARTQIGLVPQYGPPITCMVDSIDREVYLDLFDRPVLVSGVIKRNGSGQIIRIEADSVEPQQAPSDVGVEDLRGLLRDQGGPSIADYMKGQRGGV